MVQHYVLYRGNGQDSIEGLDDERRSLLASEEVA